jgi:hypothetical protein
MCAQCEELDQKIAQARRLAQPGLDQLTQKRLNALIVEYDALKLKLHPKPEE